MRSRRGSSPTWCAGFSATSNGNAEYVELAAEIVAAVFAVLTAVLVLGLFVWAAKKDGEEDRAVQSRLGIRRRRRLGR